MYLSHLVTQALTLLMKSMTTRLLERRSSARKRQDRPPRISHDPAIFISNCGTNRLNTKTAPALVVITLVLYLTQIHNNGTKKLPGVSTGRPSDQRRSYYQHREDLHPGIFISEAAPVNILTRKLASLRLYLQLDMKMGGLEWRASNGSQAIRAVCLRGTRSGENGVIARCD